MNFLNARLKSFAYALKGFVSLIKETNAKIHFLAAILVIALSVVLKISAEDWLWITLSICLVLMAELFNTAIEYLGNEISLDHKKNIGHAKDMGAAATLIAAVFAVIVAIVILVPRLMG